jgi:hypothetical protein
MISTDARALAFFLGGRDLEMVAMARLLRESGIPQQRIHDHALAWGACASQYEPEIRESLSAGLRPVLIELADDLGLGDAAMHIDHHGADASADACTSLEQVFALLALPREQWTRRLELIAANDRGWIPELRQIGASGEEIRAIRAEDRRAQGVTEDDERAAEAALANAKTLAGGRLMLVELPHTRTSPVTDRIALERGHEGQNVLILSRDPRESSLTEANFSGEGRLVRLLADRFPGGWYGGALPELGFWGHAAPVPSGIVDLLIAALTRPALTTA